MKKLKKLLENLGAAVFILYLIGLGVMAYCHDCRANKREAGLATKIKMA